jgi:superfamily II DNA or RNA helicase
VVNLVLNNRIVVGGELPKELADELCAEFTYDNPEYAKAQTFGFYKRVPKYLTSWARSDAGTLSFPRGGISRVWDILTKYGESATISNQTLDGERVVWPTPRVTLYDYQETLVAAAMAKFREEDSTCLWRSVQASGKTTAALVLAARLGRKALVIISNSVLQRQWMERVESELGIRAGQVGGGKSDLSGPVVVAMQQSMSKLSATDLARFGLVIGDEIQLFAADTFQKSVDRIPARCRLGVSGDERRADRKECLIYDQFGPIVAEVTAEDLVAKGRIHEVEVRVVRSSFTADWWTAIDRLPIRPGETVEKTAQRKARMKIDQGERLIEELCQDQDRTGIVVALAQSSVAEVGQVLVLSTRRDHCHRLDAALTAVGLRSGLLIGGPDYKAEFERTIRAFKAGEIDVAVGTYQAIGVGFDLPSMARGICAVPIANADKGAQQWRQYRGRFARSAKGKTDAALYYVWDERVYGDKPLRHLLRWNERVVIQNGSEGWVSAKTWLKRQGDDDGTKTVRRSGQRSIPGFETDADSYRAGIRAARTPKARSTPVETSGIPTSPVGCGRESGVGVSVPRRRRSEGRSG